MSLGDDVGGSCLAHALDGGESEAHLALFVGGELLLRLVHVGTEAGDVHRLTLGHELRNLSDVVKASAHIARHELGRVVRLEVRRLVSYPRVARGVRLVEGVGCELLPVAPDLLEHLRVVSVLLSALDELWLHCINDGFLLLTHRLTQSVGLATGEVGKLAREEHHLLLVDRDAVGVLQILLHAGNVVCDWFLAVLTGDERRDVVHRSRAVEGVHGDEVFEHRGTQLAQILLHTCRLELERADGASLLIELVCEFVVDRYCVEVEREAVVGEAYVLNGLLHDRQGGESEEVHLDESGLLDDVSVVLCGEQLMSWVALVFSRRHRHPVADGVAADDGAAGVDARSANGALEHLCVLYGVCHLRVGAGFGFA